MITEASFSSDLTALISRFGDAGLFFAMFLESSIIPIPSEVIIAGAGALGLPLVSICIFGSLGSTLGAIVGYSLGKYAAMPVILKFGKYVFIKPHHIYKAEAFAKKYGVASVLIGRLIPVVPFKVFSIASGITDIPFIPFLLCTLVGVLPRILVLALFGSAVVKYTKPVVAAVAALALIFVAIKLTRRIYGGAKDSCGA
jgi:membrane protein DedA with SNARE-associated domain